MGHLTVLATVASQFLPQQGRGSEGLGLDLRHRLQ